MPFGLIPKKKCFRLFYLLLFFIKTGSSNATPFEVVTPQQKASIVYAEKKNKLDSIAAYLLAADIQRVTGYLPKVTTDINQVKGNVIAIGSIQSDFIKSLAGNSFQQLINKWECYGLKVISKPNSTINKALVIAGSDARGTAYGVLSISEKIGVTPWYWWADATPLKRPAISLNIEPCFSSEPSVKYRGIFINDEDWGLQPWAAKTFEPETGDIGPKTYAKVFELLLRLKANFIWPAMHPSTKAFYHYPGNVKMAELYQIVIGSSHAEPMLRNNVDEWNEKTMGHFNYLTNKDSIYKYWEERVKQSSGVNAIYTMGMRGVHDGQMEGVKNMKEAVPVVERIIEDERGLLSKYINKDVTKVPQVLTPYKEVLEIYENGLKVPEDITLMWPDDNYGYIQRLSNENEAKRSGGSGVYYHSSYWGRPHDYLWLCTTHPALMREEMTKAYNLNARKIWVLNVGDMKPAEYNMQLFLDMAYQIDSFKNAAYTKRHLQKWCASLFGNSGALSVANILWKYYDLAWERKPEYMGWSQTEPTTTTGFTKYNHLYFHDQSYGRIMYYRMCRAMVKTDNDINIPVSKKDAYYQIVEYPITCAALMNEKFLYHDKAWLYARQGRISSSVYRLLSKQAYEQIETETKKYNIQIANGKWNGMMNMKPRKLPVFDLPTDSFLVAKVQENWRVVPEGDSGLANVYIPNISLPNFAYKSNKEYFFDIFLTKEDTLKCTIVPSANWIKVSENDITLLPSWLQSEKRITVTVDWAKAPVIANLQGSIIVRSGGKQYVIQVTAQGITPADLKTFKGFVQEDKYIFIQADHYSTISHSANRKWQGIINDETHQWLQAMPLMASSKDTSTTEAAIRKAPSVTYSFFTFDTAGAAISIYTVPTYPINQNFEMRYAVSVDDGPLHILNFKTVGRSEEWKQNVLSNSAVRTVQQALKKGKHKLTIYMIDPGVILDHIFIDLGVGHRFYGTLPETRRQ